MAIIAELFTPTQLRTLDVAQLEVLRYNAWNSLFKAEKLSTQNPSPFRIGPDIYDTKVKRAVKKELTKVLRELKKR